MDYTEQSMSNIQKNARKVGVKVKPSSRKGKKFDVYDKKTNEYITSIGASGFKDYHLYKQENKDLAEDRRDLYKKRHQNNIHEKGSTGYYAFKILWN